MSGRGGTAKLGSHELWGALIGGAVAAAVMFIIVIGVGRVGSFEALRLIEASLPTARFLAATVLGSAITVLALLLTLIGLSLSSEFTFSARLYTRSGYVTNLSVVCIVVSAAVLLGLSVPIGEVEGLRTYYDVFYYVLAFSMAVLGGLVVAMALLIGATLRGLISIGHPQGKSDLLADEEEGPDRELG